MSEMPERLESFLNYIKSVKRQSQNTVDSYRKDLVGFFKYIQYKKSGARMVKNALERIDNTDISKIDDEIIQSITLDNLEDFIGYSAEYRGNTEASQARKIAALRSFYSYLVRKRVVEHNIAKDIENIKIPKREPVYLNLEESKELISEVKNDDSKFQIRNLTIITFFLHLGCRVSELCSINLDSINGNKLRIIGKGNKERELTLDKSCLEILPIYLEWRNSIKSKIKDKNALFVSNHYTRISSKGINNVIKAYVGDTSISKNVTAHALRHSAASLLYSNGVGILELQKLLGHSNINTTQHYSHLFGKSLEEAVNLNPLNDI